MEEKRVDKSSSMEEKVKYLQIVMKDEAASDEIGVHNLFCLLSTQVLPDELFEKETVIFNDLEDFSDIKTELRPDLTELKKKLAYYYMSILTSCRQVSFPKNDSIVDLPKLYSILIGNLGFFTLNNILYNQLDSIDKKSLVIVNNSLTIMGFLTRPLFIMDDLIKAFEKGEK